MKLKEMFGKAKTWTMEHKKEIAIAVCTAVGGYTIYKVVGGKIFKSDMVTLIEDGVRVSNDLPIPEIDTGVITDLWLEKEYPHAIIEDLKLTDMGKLGENLASINQVAKDGAVSAVICMTKNVEA